MQSTANMLYVTGAEGKHLTVFTNGGSGRNHYVPTWKYCYATWVLCISWPCVFSLVTHMGICLPDRLTHLQRIFQMILKHAYLAENTKSVLGPTTLSLLNLKFSPTTKNKLKNPATMPDFCKFLYSVVARWISTSNKTKVMSSCMPFCDTCYRSLSFGVVVCLGFFH